MSFKKWTCHRAHLPVDGEYDYGIREEGQLIAETFGRSSETHRHDAKANAELISSAPELLSACENAAAALIAVIQITERITMNSVDKEALHRLCLDKSHELIQVCMRAKGESHE